MTQQSTNTIAVCGPVTWGRDVSAHTLSATQYPCHGDRQALTIT